MFSALFTLIITTIIFLGIMMNIFFKSLIIWRNFNFRVDVEYINEISKAIGGICDFLNIPGFEYLFYPLYVAVDLLSNLKIDLSAINITCDGAQAPMELVMNIFIMGLVIIVIESDYQKFQTITLSGFTAKFMASVTYPSYQAFVHTRVDPDTGVVSTKNLAWVLGEMGKIPLLYSFCHDTGWGRHIPVFLAIFNHLRQFGYLCGRGWLHA